MRCLAKSTWGWGGGTHPWRAYGPAPWVVHVGLQGGHGRLQVHLVALRVRQLSLEARGWGSVSRIYFASDDAFAPSATNLTGKPLPGNEHKPGRETSTFE